MEQYFEEKLSRFCDLKRFENVTHDAQHIVGAGTTHSERKCAVLACDELEKMGRVVSLEPPRGRSPHE